MALPIVARAIVSIGVTGHRAARLGDIDMAALTAVVERTLVTVGLAVAGVPGLPVELRLITALADGADTIVAECALARGWRLDSVLPFTREAYLADFAAPQSRAAYRRLLARSDVVVELPGVHRDHESSAAYECAGRFVLARADVLLAIWDGRPAQGRGGTGQIVAEAVMQDLPVILIDPEGAQVPVLLWSGLTGNDRGRHSVTTVPRGSLDALPGAIRKRLLSHGQLE